MLASRTCPSNRLVLMSLRNLMHAVLVIFAALFISSNTLAANTPNAHDITLERLDGSTLNLADLSGTVIVLNVWATWCAPCRKEMPELENLQNQSDPKKIRVIGISIDRTPEKMAAYLEETKITFSNFIDRRQKVTRPILKIKGLPTTYIFNTKGVLVSEAKGPRKWDAPEIIMALKNIYSGKPFDPLAFNPEK